MIRKLGLLTAFVATGMLSVAVSAQAAEGQPSPWQLGLQAAGDERMRDIIGLVAERNGVAAAAASA